MKREITEIRLSSERWGNLNFPTIGGSQKIKKSKKKNRTIIQCFTHKKDRLIR